MWHQRLLFCLTQTLFHGFFNACQTSAVLVFSEFANTTHTAVAEVVNVIDFAVAIAQVHQNFDHREDVLVRHDHGASRRITAHAGIEFHAANTRQIVGIRVVEQALEQGLNRVFSGRLARAHHAVNRYTCSEFISRLIRPEGLRDVRALIKLVGIQHLQVFDTSHTQLFKEQFAQFIVGFGDDFTRICVNDVFGDHTSDQEIFRYADARGAAGFQLAGVTHGDALVLGYYNFAGLVSDVKTGHFAAHALGNEFHLGTAVHQAEVVKHKEVGEDGFLI